MPVLPAAFRDLSPGGRAWVSRGVLAVAALAVAFGLLSHSSQASAPWKWRDLSQQAGGSADAAVTLAAGRGEDWLLSDGERLWSANANAEVTDYSDRVRGRGRVQAIGADGGRYLVALRGANGAELLSTDLRAWSDLPDLRFPLKRVRALEGNGGRWGLVTEDLFDGGSLPRTWQASLWNTDERTPAALALPTGVSAFVPGCFKPSTSGTSICAGAVALLPLRGEWYLFAGQAETRDGGRQPLQTGKAGVWRWKDGQFVPVANAPAARFVSGVWRGEREILFATTDAVTNPFAADTYWTFDGTSFRAFRDEPLEAGLFSVDTRLVHAGWTETSWAITAGQNLVQFRDGSFALEGRLRDTANVVAGGRNGLALVAGRRGTETPTEARPAQPFLALLGETFATDDAAFLVQPPQNIAHRDELASIRLSGDPSPATIGNGESFAFRAEATDGDGLQGIDLLVNGARVAGCVTSPCRYTQAYWTNGAPERRVLLTARVTDRTGRVTESQALVLTVKDTPAFAAEPSGAASPAGPGLMPAGLSWSQDAGTGIGSTSWISPTSSFALTSAEPRVFSAAATHPGGIARIELWVNGSLKRTCGGEPAGGVWICQAPLGAGEYAVGTDILANARIIAGNGRETWTAPLRLQRQ